MRLSVIVILGILLTAGSAVAHIPAGSLISVGPVPEGKMAVQSAQALGLLDCTGATEITLDNTYYGDNTGLLSNVAGYGCGYWYEPGGEVVYHLFLAEPAMFQATVEGDWCDVDLAVLDQCDENAGCIALVDATVATTEPVSGDIYFVVDGYSEEGCPFTFTITSLPMPEPVSFCALVQTMPDTVFWGNNCDGQNLVSSLECSQYPMNGLEHYYAIVMEPGSSFTVTVTSTTDAALWLLGTCVEPFACLDFVDETLTLDPEVMSYTNSTPETITVYLVIDSYNDGFCGTYDVEYHYMPGQVSVKPMDWGSIKSLFR
jgi:hypothetical protein